jgi:adenylate kinase family enzyme
MSPLPYKRIVVVGVTGCGKSTMAERLAKKLDYEFIELDSLYWKPGWVDSSRDEFRARVEEVTRHPCWVLAGNYGVTRDIVWSRAEAIVWLDFSFFLVLCRLVRRTWIRWRTQELLWGTNYEPFWVHFKLWSKDSLINWMFQSYWRHKRAYPRLLSTSVYSHLKLLRFKTPHAADSWLYSL